MEGPFSATGVSKDGLCSADSITSTSGSNLRQGQRITSASQTNFCAIYVARC